MFKTLLFVATAGWCLAPASAQAAIILPGGMIAAGGNIFIGALPGYVVQLSGTLPM